MYTSASATGSPSLVSSWLAEGEKFELNTLLLVSTLWPPAAPNRELVFSVEVGMMLVPRMAFACFALRERVIPSAASKASTSADPPSTTGLPVNSSSMPGSGGGGAGMAGFGAGLAAWAAGAAVAALASLSAAGVGAGVGVVAA